MQTITILGVNGRIGQEVAKAFVGAKWRVIGMGRGNRVKLEGVEFFEGDVNFPDQTKQAIAEADVVFNALNLPYDKWDKGRAEALLSRVLDAMKGSGKTLMFPGNIYNYAASEHVITPDTLQKPEKEKGEIRKRMEEMLARASVAGDIQTLIIRTGDFFAPGAEGTGFDMIMMRDIKKGVLQYPGALSLYHSWAYLPDVAEVYVKIAQVRQEFAQFESFHFTGHFATGLQMIEAMQAALPQKAKLKAFPWGLLRFLGLFMSLMREVVKMKYLWDVPQRLEDKKLEALLGQDFGTPFDVAVAKTTRSYLP